MRIGMGAVRGCGGDVGVGVDGDGRHSQLPPLRSISPTEVHLNFPNPHPQVEDDPEHDSGIFILFFVMSAVD
jgi:hypothetical protein